MNDSRPSPAWRASRLRSRGDSCPGSDPIMGSSHPAMNMSEAPNDQQASAGPGGDRIGYPFWLALACVVAIIHRLVRQVWTQYRWDVRLNADHDIRRPATYDPAAA